MEIFKKIINSVWDLIEAGAFSLGLFVVCYTFLFGTAQIVGASSYPTLHDGERYVVDKLSYRFESPRRGDFIIMESPNNSDIDFVKRIVGLPAETIRIADCSVYIDNQILKEPYLSPGTCTGPENSLIEKQDLKIPQNFYFVMGDNRSHSSDSRDFGSIPLQKIVGRVIWRWLPLDRFGPSPK